jgi:glycerol-3-phosphate dehydrogenase
MLTITGGKLTTWRAMAEQVVDRLVERDGLDAACRTREIPLGLAIDAADLPRVEGVADDAYEALASRYGYAAHRVLEVAAERGELAQPILPGRPDLIGEAVFALRHEQARSLADVLLRRTRLGLVAGRELCDPDGTATARVARAMGDELGWDAARVASELDRFGTIAEVEGLVPERSDRHPPTTVR